MEKEYRITWIGGCQNGNEQSTWVNAEQLIAIANEDAIPTIADVDSAIEYLNSLEYSIEIENIPKIDSAGFESNGINHHQEKLN